MHGLRLCILVGMCCTTCLVMSGALPVKFTGESSIDETSHLAPIGKIDSALDAKLGQMLTEQKLPSDKGFSPVQATKELAEKAITMTSMSLPPTVQKEEAIQPEAIHSTSQAQQTEPDAKPEPPVVQEEMMSIDTMDLDQPAGNWLNKRIWWERAKDKYKECRDVFEAIFASRMGFLEKRSEIEKTILDPFYREIGVEQADLRDVLTELIDIIEDERQEEGFLDDKARTFRDKVTAAKKDIEQLKLDIDAINNIDDAIDKAVNTLSDKINEAHRFEKSAWNEFEAIAHELSDKRARERYFVIDGIHKNLKDLQKYIVDEFTTYFNGLVKASKDNTERAKKEVKALKDQDIDLEAQAQMLVAEDQLTEEQAQMAAKAAEEARKAAEAAKVGIFGHIWAWIAGALKGLWNLLFGWWLYRI